MFSSSSLLARPSQFSCSAACLHCEQLTAHLDLAQFQSFEWPNVGVLSKVETIEFWTWRLSVESPKWLWISSGFSRMCCGFPVNEALFNMFSLFSWLQYYLSKAKCTFLVAEFDSSIVGFIAVDQKSETRATVTRMSVDTCFRGRRKLIATRLLQEAFSFCQDCGYDDLMVEFPGINKTKTHRLRHCDVKPTRQDFFVARQGWTSRKDNYVAILRTTWSCDVTRRDHSSKVPWRHWLAT